MDIRAKLSTLWIVVMFNMVFADILGFQMTLMSGNLTPEIQVPAWGMLIFAIILQIPILMIFLSRILKQTASRWKPLGKHRCCRHHYRICGTWRVHRHRLHLLRGDGNSVYGTDRPICTNVGRA